ncbi:hypothetical protein [Planotetraspora mira]|uniref:hypothetical protein n=1 Tax=Planotetraspora mira TaxID=58121 RepID=UPI0036728784
MIALSGAPGQVIFDESSDLPFGAHPRTGPRFAALRERLADVVRSAASGGTGVVAS